MKLVGVIVLLFGGGLLYYGYEKNSNWSAQVMSLLSRGGINPGTPLIIAGAILILVGLGLLLYSIKQNNRNS